MLLSVSLFLEVILYSDLLLGASTVSVFWSREVTIIVLTHFHILHVYSPRAIVLHLGWLLPLPHKLYMTVNHTMISDWSSSKIKIQPGQSFDSDTAVLYCLFNNVYHLIYTLHINVKLVISTSGLSAHDIYGYNLCLLYLLQ